MKQIICEPDTRADHCKQIIRSAAIAYRPLQLQELVATAELPDRILDSIRYLKDLVERCGSFLTVRNEVIFFIHQSAKDYVISGKGQEDLRFDLAEEHYKITCRSLSILSKALTMDICNLKKPSILNSEVGEDIVRKTVYRIEYACCYWVYHLYAHAIV
jgi:hypothetical protein